MQGFQRGPNPLFWFIIGWLVVLTACRNAPADTPLLAARVNPSATPLQLQQATAVPTTTPTATSTPLPTQTPSPTPTPTATAVPLTVTGDIRSLLLSDPVPSGAAACGLVDLFDFPIDPPDAANISRGGGDFGIFRDRFDKFHAGEDWGGPSGRSNLGTPVYSIGHGLVTYAQPLGWGRDQGVVIVQHTFADGRSLLSFYGHLDPDSVVLAPGSCVRRGEPVGQIGQPRGFPHLHFEVRTQAPYQTLTGYWPEDPTTQGWLWPSQQIWAARVGAIPGVGWVRPFANRGSQPIGPIDDSSYLILEGGNLLRLNLADGRTNPIIFPLETIDAALLHEGSNLLFLANRQKGSLAAYTLPDLIFQWQIDISLDSAIRLLPLPGGGVLAATRTRLTAVAPDGLQQWTQPLESQVLDWLLWDEALYLATDGNDGRLWRVQAGDAVPVVDLGGKLAANSAGLWLYNRQAVYQIGLGGGEPTANLIYQLPTGTISRGDLLALPDGGLLLAHADIADRRLLQFDGNGRLIWERSYAGVVEGNVTLHLLNAQPYLAASLGSGNNGELTLYTLDQAQNRLARLFAGGSRTPLANDFWVTAVSPNQLLINVGGGPLALFDPAASQRLISEQ